MIRFIRKAGRIIPIKVSGMQKAIPTEIEHIVEVRKERKIVKLGIPKDELHGTFWKYTKERSKKTGNDIARRISVFRKKGIMK